jgi:hypothetical protein
MLPEGKRGLIQDIMHQSNKSRSTAANWHHRISGSKFKSREATSQKPFAVNAFRMKLS